MLTLEQKEQFSQILEELGNALDITEEQHTSAVRSYEFVGSHLAAENSPLAKYNPEILPQGSFLLGTMIKPIHEEDELDIDLVCRLEGKNPGWTQYDLKQIIGNRLKDHGTLSRLLKTPDGRRCWTLEYSDARRFHLDILPSIVSSGYRYILEKAFAAKEHQDMESLAIRITDKKLGNYWTCPRPEEWHKCNPFGYGLWFAQQARIQTDKAVLLNESIQPVPKYQKEKLPLQRVVQILKRHRDMMFNGDEHKPVSIIISTLAARAYRKETNILEALVNVIDRMPDHIQEVYSPIHGRIIKWVGNPVNVEENFADKWAEMPQKEQNFSKWMGQVRKDVAQVVQQKERGLHQVVESMKAPFGGREVSKAFSTYGEKQLRLRESGKMKMAAGTGIIGTAGRASIPQHNNYGKKE
jgi:hypothetical protein